MGWQQRISKGIRLCDTTTALRSHSYTIGTSLHTAGLAFGIAAKAQVRNVTPLVELHADWSSLTSPNYTEGVSSPWRAVGTAIDNIATIKTVLDPHRRAQHRVHSRSNCYLATLNNHVDPTTTTARLEQMCKVSKLMLVGMYSTESVAAMAWRKITYELVSKPPEGLVLSPPL
jgi:hypothetical protein